MFETILEKANGRLLQLGAALIASMSFLSAGMSVSWIVPILPKLLAENSHIPMTRDESSWVVSILSIGCVVGVIPLIFLTNILGRKELLLLSALPYSIGWCIIVFAASVEALYVARFLFGVSIIITFTITPMYITEISEVGIRGFLSSSTQFFYSIGSLYEYAMGPYVSYNVLGITSVIFPIAFLLMMCRMPETPYFLLLKGKCAEAEKSLMKLRGKTDKFYVQEELTLVKNVVEESVHLKRAPVHDLFYKRSNRRAFILILGLVSLQQFCGQLAVVSYTTEIFLNTASSLDANISVIILGVIQAISSVVMSSIVDRTGRKPLLLLSTIGLAVSTLVLGIYFYLNSNTGIDLTYFDWIPIVCLIVYLSLFSIALGVLPFTIMGEIFPPNVKGLASSSALLLHAGTGVLVTKVFQIMTDDIGADAPFWLFSIYCIVSAFFIARYLPETKGKTFSEIYEEFNGDSFPRRVKTGPDEVTKL